MTLTWAEIPKRVRILWVVILLLGSCTILVIGNRSGWQRLEEVRRELAGAGFDDAHVARSQTTNNMGRCRVGQVQNRGYAYSWTAGSRRGVFCLPIDGRPNQILIDDNNRSAPSVR